VLVNAVPRPVGAGSGRRPERPEQVSSRAAVGV